jgi:hypothetical protein
MVDFNRTSRPVSVDRALERFSLNLEIVEFCLQAVKASYSLASLQRNIPNLKREMVGLRTLKKGLVGLVGGFEKSIAWKCPKNHKPAGGATWTEKRMVRVLKKDYGLEGFFIAIDRRAKHLKKMALLFENLDAGLRRKKKLIQLHTIFILVLITAMKPEPGTMAEKFRTIVNLLDWLSSHRERLLKETLGQERIYVTSEAIRRDYERYMQHPTKKTRVYSDLVHSIVADIFSEEED